MRLYLFNIYEEWFKNASPEKRTIKEIRAYNQGIVDYIGSSDFEEAATQYCREHGWKEPD